MRGKRVALGIAIGMLTLLCVIVLYPLLHPGLVVTDDLDWFIIRLTAFYQSFREGQFPVRFLGRLNYNFGYPVANFNYPLYLYAGSVLRAGGFPFETIMKLMMGGSFIFSLFFLWLWLRTTFGLRARYFGILSFIVAPYLFFDMYTRGSIGEIIALPFVFAALFCIEKRYMKFLPLAIFGLCISHNTVAVIMIAFLIGYVCVKRYWTLIVPVGIGILLSSFFWIPALHEQSFVQFSSVRLSEPIRFFPISHRLIYASLPMLASAAWIFLQKKKTVEQSYFFAIFVVCGFITSAASIGFWRSDLSTQLIQFPYRFLIVWVVVGPWMIASAIESVRQKNQLIIGICCIVWMGLYMVFQIPRLSYVVRPEGFYTTNESTSTIANEYMPIWVQILPTKRADTRLEIFSGSAEILHQKMNSQTINAVIKSKGDSILQINTIYYPGWGGMMDGKPVRIMYDNPRGLMHVVIPDGEHTITLQFRETFSRFIADAISVFGLIVYILYILLYSRPDFIRKIRPYLQSKHI